MALEGRVKKQHIMSGPNCGQRPAIRVPFWDAHEVVVMQAPPVEEQGDLESKVGLGLLEVGEWEWESSEWRGKREAVAVVEDRRKRRRVEGVRETILRFAMLLKYSSERSESMRKTYNHPEKCLYRSYTKW